MMFPPGRARLGTSPRPIGLATPTKTMGMVVVACWAARALAAPHARISATGRRTSSAARSGSLVEVLGIAVLQGDLLALDPAQVTQPLPEALEAGREARGGAEHE